MMLEQLGVGTGIGNWNGQDEMALVGLFLLR